MAPSDASTIERTRDAAIRARLAGENPVDYLRRRGYVQDISNEAGLRALFDRETVTAYIGFDPTAASLHVGHLLSIMMLHWLQQTGNKPVALMGGGTTRVGDPSGRDETRKILSIEDIDANKEKIKTTFDKFLRFGTRKGDAVMADNWDITTSDGSIVVTLPGLFNAELDAETSDGAVRTNHPLLEDHRDDRRDGEDGDERRERRRVLRSKIGDGGKTFKIRSGDGTIRIER